MDFKVADAHCDTLLKFPDNQFNSENAAWNLEKFKKSNGILQYMAVCIEPPYHGDSALRYAFNLLGRFWHQKPDEVNFLGKSDDFDENKINVLPAIEGASPIIDDINNLSGFYQMGVRAMTLTWNHRNFVGDGVNNNFGLTVFGNEVVREMEKIGMIVDISHLSDKGFEDLISVAAKPFAATHSNARAIFNHPRNLTDDQIKEIVKRKGFIGINFYSAFLDSSRKRGVLLDKLADNFEFILKLGGSDVLGLGADFDGMSESPISDAAQYSVIYEILNGRLTLPEEQIQKIMYKNLVDFTLRMI